MGRSSREVEDLDVALSDEAGGDSEGLDFARGAIAMAVEMRCAITQPTIFSRCVADEDEEDGGERRNRYAFEVCKLSWASCGADSVMLTVSSSVASCQFH